MPNHHASALKAEARNLNFFYGPVQALKKINMPIYDKKVTALIGPSGCGKSTYPVSYTHLLVASINCVKELPVSTNSKSFHVLMAAGAVLFGAHAAQAQVIKIDGSSTVYPITEAVAEEFQKAKKSTIKVTCLLYTSRCV